MATYHLNSEDVVIEDYARARAFSSLLPSIAGVWGIPMWAFYVNRGQAIAGFGIQDKDHPIMEFEPANRAYRSAPLQGFRTFLKLTTRRATRCYEPFRPSAHQRMRISLHDLVLEERNASLGLDIRVQYFTIPHEPFAGLARVLTITNRSRAAQRLELIDGLPVMVPHGMLDRLLKQMSRTMEAWVAVDNVGRGAPFYRLKVDPRDRPEVVPIRAGNFYVACATLGSKPVAVQPIVDPSVVFGYREDFSSPDRFLARSFRVPTQQLACDKTPCAMSFLRVTLPPRRAQTVYALYGHMESLEQLNASLSAIRDPAFFHRKAEEQRRLIREITEPIATTSGHGPFDAYCRQTFLDNVLRGGSPLLLGRSPAGRRVFYVYARKHGDLERDYNHFVIPPTFFSQGHANYRDVNQNRRNDVWFYPEVGDHNIVTFFNLLQPDGFNPLVFKGIRYVPADRAALPPALREAMGKSFTPGELLKRLERRRLKAGESPEALLHQAIEAARPAEDAEHGEGFWIDHWTYNLDLLESYLALYPERLRELLLQQRVFTFYDNPFVVLPRSQKYRLLHGTVRQLHAVARDPEKDALIRARAQEPHVVRIRSSKGPVYQTTLLVKMLCVVVNKLASLDPDGLGVEMEADKPNWFDALNGLPALLGSSLCETFELKRWLVFLLTALDALRVNDAATTALPEELREFLIDLQRRLKQEASFWERSAQAKERYRSRVRLGFSGAETSLTMRELKAFLRQAIGKVDRGIQAAYNKRQRLYHSYFTYTVTAQTTTGGEHPTVTPTAWKRHALPPFLGGMVHALRMEPDPKRAKALHHAVRKSPLYDRRLGMYRVCAPLTDESEEIGRCRIFTPGWLEHQSIWLHMEYKYLLELLRSGLYAEFYQDLFKTLIPFQPPARYGRSILENSSFLVSSVYPDRTLHGAGFVARLSGATAEFLHLWLWMTAGKSPFSVTARGELSLRFDPILSKEFFTASGRFAFRFLGRTQVTYLNPRRLSTFGQPRAIPRTIRLQPRTGSRIELAHGTVPPPYAAMVRAGEIERIDVELLP